MSGVQRLLQYHIVFDPEEFMRRVPECPQDAALIADLWALVQPFLFWRDAKITARNQEEIVLDDGALVIPSCYVSKGLQQCQWATVMALSIGPNLPAESVACNQNGAFYRASVADLLGSHGVELLANQFCQYLQQAMLPQGRFLTPRYSPGYGDWELSEQPKVLAYLNGADGKIQLSENNLMEPVKTITALIGWSTVWQKPDYPKGEHNSFCNGGHNCVACTTWACRRG